MFNRIEITSERIPSKSLILDYTTNLQNEKIDQNNIIIYGRNGTGKSTLCREIGKLKLNEESDIKEPANVNFYTDKELKNDSINTENIYVYNDDFQKKYVTFSETGSFETIVMLGNQGEIQNKIDEINEKIINLEKNKEKNYQQLNVLNIDQRKEDILFLLKGDANWAGRQRRIYQNKNNTPVNRHYQSIISENPKEQENNLRSQLFDDINKIERYKKIEESEYKKCIKIFDDFKFINDKIEKNTSTQEIMNSIITNEIQNSILKIGKTLINNSTLSTFLEKRITKSVEDYGSKHANNIINLMDNEKASFCPTCFQNIEKHYKDEIKNILIKILEESNIEDLEKRIKSIEIEKITPIENIKYLNSNVVNKVNKCIYDYNNSVDKLNEELENKLNKLNEKVTFESSINNLKNNLFDLIESVRILFKEIKEIQDYKKNKQSLIKRATKKNSELAYLEIKPQLEIYQENEKIYFKIKNRIDNIEKDIINLNKDKSKLNAKLKQTDIALESQVQTPV